MIGTVISAAATAFLVAMAVISDGWGTLWFSVLAVGGVIETVALYRKQKGDTLSESVWRKTTKPWQRWLLGAFMVWLTFHFVFENPFD